MKTFSNLILKLTGWRIVGELPGPKSILIGAPHTSNWDLPVALLTFWNLSFSAHWIGKHTIFKPPLGGLMRKLGGIPIDRGTTKDFVPEVVSWFERESELTILIAPEGTRSRTEYWRSGFYWIAHGAGIPIGLGFVDYPSRTAGIGISIMPTGDIAADMEKIRDFYADKIGRHPENASTVDVRPT